MKYGLVQPFADTGTSGLVVQVEDQKFDVAEPLFWADGPDTIVVGMEYRNGKFSLVASPADINESRPDVSRRNFRLGLIRAGLDEKKIVDMIYAIEDPAESLEVEIEWTDSLTFSRGSSFVDRARKLFKLTNDQMNAIWDQMLAY